jgi:hypothetical protein
MTYKGYAIYKAFGNLVAVQISEDKVLGFFTSLDEAMRAINAYEAAMIYADPTEATNVQR